ncbi:hypothetical protein H2199_006469 [Coniosporium tulheliwenetii]|uniref:Uncharacterized protein n=1 Tax=Coniosporium tulheliwenetii TaxID=3383036 RepID=A0ACC2YVT0_9PEZI|nr:hypothetical protein H2199_006469 [Cladosporium sp. JES 115]
MANQAPPTPARPPGPPRSDSWIKLPGFGLPLTDMPVEWRPDSADRMRFPNALMDWVAKGVTVRERIMLEFINLITDKPDWDRKVFDEDIVRNWRQEALVDGANFSEKMFEFCVLELRDKAKRFQETGVVAVLDTEATIVKSDQAIPLELEEALRVEVASLENVPGKQKDWHPGSDGKVLDLVHPSLFPLIYEQTRVLTKGRVKIANCMKRCGGGQIIPESEEFRNWKPNWYSEIRSPAFWSQHFQWLPCEVSFTAGGGVKIDSYINNLHPEQQGTLYKIIEQFIAKAVPLWDETLARFHPRLRINVDRDEWEYPLGRIRPPQGDDPPSDSDDLWELEHDWEMTNRVLVQPEPLEYKYTNGYASAPDHSVDLRQDFKEQGLQIIVKLANIHLTPENSDYEGGSWHVEGCLNEHICATAIYYYDSENVTDSFLEFRQRTDAEDMMMKPEQNDYVGIERLYNVQHEDPAVQTLGRVETRQGRLLSFPNVLQHRVAPFRLADPTKPGHRKILALFLVDPHIRIISTANVPPQRQDWWAQELRRGDTRLARLPEELLMHVMSYVDFPMGMEEAKEERLELMAERTIVDDNVNEQYLEGTFNFCEH